MIYNLKLIVHDETIIVQCREIEDCYLIISLASHRFNVFDWTIEVQKPFGVNDEISRGYFYAS